MPLVRQAETLGISRGSLYYEPHPVSVADLAIMRRINRWHVDHPFAAGWMMRDLLRGERIAIGRNRVVTMMRRMGIEALYRRLHTSKPADGHKVDPYLLRDLTIERVNQVWAMEITHIPMARGFVYLSAVMDSFSRRVPARRVSITLGAEFCLDAVDEALADAYDSVVKARTSIGQYLRFYNRTRPHSSLGGRTPDQVYLGLPRLARVARVASISTLLCPPAAIERSNRQEILT